MKSLLLLLSLLITSFCFSPRIITGTVSDADDSLLGAIVTVKGSKIYTETDFDGNYSIEAKSTDTLVFSYTGYDSQEVIVKNQTVINVELSFDGIIGCRFPLAAKENIKLIYGVNYNTYGLKYRSEEISLFDIKPSIQYSTGFDSNSYNSFSLRKNFYINNEKLTATVAFETADFNNLQYHSYKFEAEKGIEVFNRYDFIHFKLITGYVNYDSSSNMNKIGVGLGVEKKYFHDYIVGANFIHWQEFNEFNANASYNWRRWNISGNYKHLASYEEFQLGLGYSFYF
ncbi:carboxypeptidase-like regulatory domain-containing protein [Nonlabens sp. Asnod2-A12]|uniref:carboxypeptidase-like regulatory domain-containing protein n=1 Tax=Nonlabens sp. Asnod2-A12 TaxID=3160578 RepID=UPI0038632DD8